jgi:hypothetical protein
MVCAEIITLCSEACTKHKNAQFCFEGRFFLGTFAKFRKGTISFVMSFRLSVYPHRTAWHPLEGFS